MLMYRAAAWFIRTYAPEIAMGMYTEDEIIDVTPDQNEKAQDINVAEEIKKKANSEEFDISEEELKQETKPEPEPAEEKEDKEQPEQPKSEKKESSEQTSMSDSPGFALDD
jgi:outer membrane biosynthesis protein TonB